jgi:hypothetical protein
MHTRVRLHTLKRAKPRRPKTERVYVYVCMYVCMYSHIDELQLACARVRAWVSACVRECVCHTGTAEPHLLKTEANI